MSQLADLVRVVGVAAGVGSAVRAIAGRGVASAAGVVAAAMVCGVAGAATAGGAVPAAAVLVVRGVAGRVAPAECVPRAAGWVTGVVARSVQVVGECVVVAASVSFGSRGAVLPSGGALGSVVMGGLQGAVLPVRSLVLVGGMMPILLWRCGGGGPVLAAHLERVSLLIEERVAGVGLSAGVVALVGRFCRAGNVVAAGASIVKMQYPRAGPVGADTHFQIPNAWAAINLADDFIAPYTAALAIVRGEEEEVSPGVETLIGGRQLITQDGRVRIFKGLDDYARWRQLALAELAGVVGALVIRENDQVARALWRREYINAAALRVARMMRDVAVMTDWRKREALQCEADFVLTRV